MTSEVNEFIQRTSKSHRRINPCFMNGKGCVYTEQIDREIERRKSGGRTKSDKCERDKSCVAGFMVIPFQPNISTFFDLCLKRYICSTYPTENTNIDIVRADQVRRTGYVICEKICKKIQESDFVVVDVSIPNANVFYELGLAYGIDQKIILIYHHKSIFGKKVSEYFHEAGCRAFEYYDLNPITVDQFPLSTHVWKRESKPFATPSAKTLVFDNLSIPEEKSEDKKTSEDATKVVSMDISLGFTTHVKAAIGVAVDNIYTALKSDEEHKIPEEYFSQIEKLKTAEVIKKSANFNEIINKIEQAFCSIIKTGGKNCNPMMYFWLGYCHALGKNVIPISMLKKKEDDVDDLAFDIRALWHLIFYTDNPRILETELEGIFYQMVINDYTEWSRRRFWDAILGKRGKVSIFTGALHNPQIGREMIGDWDLRAASELTSYFASHQYRATIESPVYQIEQISEKPKAVDRKKYIFELVDMLKSKNCVIIASPDVNPLTEIVLAEIYGISQDQLFNSKAKVEGTPNAVVAIKQKKVSEGNGTKGKNELMKVNRAFYKEEYVTNKDTTPMRGFKASFLKNGEILGEFVSQTEDPKEFKIHAHFAIATNPYKDDSNAQETQGYIIVLNGVSGPATFALTHVLTGGVSNEFVAYGDGFNPDAESEKILSKILGDLNTMKERKESALQYIIEIEVGPPERKESHDQKPRRSIFDWRHICRWRLIPTANFFKKPEKSGNST